MSLNKRIAFGAAANVMSRAVTIVLQFVLTPVLFRHLPKEELGVWMLLAQTSALLLILDFGLSAVLTRRIALAKGKSGSDPNGALNDETRRDIAALVASGRVLFLALAVATFVISLLSGFIYLRNLHLTTVGLPVVWTSWAVLCLSQAFGVWAQTWNCLLNGVGYVGWDSVINSAVQAATQVVQIAAVFLGAGLITLAVSTAVGLFAQRYLLFGFARRRRPELFATHGRFDPALVRGMISPSLRAWATGFGSLLILQTDPYFIAGLSGVAQVPAYRAAYLVFFNINTLAVMFAGASAVFISHLWQAGEIDGIHRLVVRNLRLGLGLMAAAGGCVALLGPRLFDLYLGPGNFIGYPILGLFFALMFLETQCYAITLGSRATEDEAFAFWSLGGAALKLVLAALLGLRFGLPGIAASTLVAQLATNHWYMVYRGLRRLRISFATYATSVLLPVGALFVLVALGVGLPLVFNLFAGDWQAVLGSSCIAGLILAGFLWCLVLEPNHRERLVARWQFARQ